MQNFLVWLRRSLSWMQNNPVLYKGKHFHIINFGIFAGINAMAIVSVMMYYLHLKGIEMTPQILFMFPIGGLLVFSGAKLMHLVSLGRKFLINPRKYLFETGFYLQGGIMGAILWSILFAFSTNINLSVVWDGLALGTLLGQFFGRLGCFNYGCCFGKTTSSKWGLPYQNSQNKILRLKPHFKGVPIHPAQLYKAILNLIAFIILLILLPYVLPNGILAIIFLIYHGLSRMVFEYFRGDIYFDQKRNWITHKFAFMAIVVGFLLSLFGSFLDAAFYERWVFVQDYSVQAFIKFYWQTPSILIGILLLGIFIFVGYGIHGKKLGRFPIPERSSHAHEDHDHRSRTIWD